MTKKTLWMVALALVLSGAPGAYQLVSGSGQKADCPGKIVCALTGQPICKDRCPLHPAADRASDSHACCRARLTAARASR